MLIRYRAPAILAIWRGEAPVMEFISDFPQLVLMALGPGLTAG
jgi:hypothetical protein